MFPPENSKMHLDPNDSRCLQTKVDMCLLNSDLDNALSIADRAMERGYLVPKVGCLSVFVTSVIVVLPESPCTKRPWSPSSCFGIPFQVFHVLPAL